MSSFNNKKIYIIAEIGHNHQGSLEKAKEIGMKTIGFTGRDGGRIYDICDFCIRIPSDDTPRIQEAHILIGHIICQLIESKLFIQNQ